MTSTSFSKSQEERPIMIIDGFNLFIKNMMVNETISSNGIPVGGVVGFIKSINALVRDYVPQEVYICWESGGPSSRRKKLFEGYKNNRTSDKKMFKEIKKDDDRKWILRDADNRAQQMHILVNVLKHLPICQLYLQDVEADDLVCYLAKFKFTNKNCKKIIISSDKDFYQLLDTNDTIIFDTTKKTFITKEKVKELYDISPNNFALAKCIVGDESDNVPGIEGIGFKLLVKRFPMFNNEEYDLTIQDIIEYCNKEVESGNKIKVYRNVLDGKIILERNWKLMRLSIKSMAPNQIQKIDYAVDNFVPKMDKLSLIKGIVSNHISCDIDFDSLSSNMKITLC